MAYRFIVRSKDAFQGVPNNFQVKLPFLLPANSSNVSIKLCSVSIGTYFGVNDTATIAAANTASGLPNQPNLPAASSTPNTYGFDTNSFIDLCITGVPTTRTLDSELCNRSTTYTTSAIIGPQAAVLTMAIPTANKVGLFVSGNSYGSTGDLITIAGLTGYVSSITSTGLVITFGAVQTWGSIPSGTTFSVTPAQPWKTRSDYTLANIPYSRADCERTCRILTDCEPVKVSSCNFGSLNIKLFNDAGLPLKLRKFYSNGTADNADQNIGDWFMELLVTAN